MENIVVSDPIILIIGIAFLLAGWLLYWVSLHVAGGIIGVGIGLTLGSMIAAEFEMELWIQYLIMAVSALLAAVLLIFILKIFHHAFFFSVGALLGAGIGLAMARQLIGMGYFAATSPDIVHVLSAAFMGVLFGIIFFFAQTTLIILSTATVGSLLIMDAMAWSLGALAFPVMLVCGVAFQFLMSGKKRIEDEDDEE